MISNSFYQMVIKNYIPNKKISTLMFGLNSFSKLLHKRMSTINKLVKSFQDNLYDAESTKICWILQIIRNCLPFYKPLIK